MSTTAATAATVRRSPNGSTVSTGRRSRLLLRYGPGDWNALHRDLYGELVFPLQVVVGLDEPDVDFTGGEFVMVEQRPRAQSRATVTAIAQGGALATPRPRSRVPRRQVNVREPGRPD